MKMNRVICALLALLLVLPLAVMGVSAAEEQKAAEKTKRVLLSVAPLGWKETTGAYSAQGLYAVQSVKGFTGTGGTALRLTAISGNWGAIEVLSADQMAGVSSYTVSMNILPDLSAGGIFGVRVGSTEEEVLTSSKGEWIYFDKNGELYACSYGNAANASNAKRQAVSVDGYAELSIEVQPASNRINVYWNGTQIFQKTAAHNTVGGVWLLFGGSGTSQNVTELDDLMVTKGSYANRNTASNIIYSEDFEAYAPYEARDTIQTGTVLYEENFGSVASDTIPSRIRPSSNYSPSGATSKILTSTANGGYLSMVKENGGGGGWYGYEIVPAAALVGVKKFTVRYELSMDYTSEGASNFWAGGVHIRFGAAADSGKSNWFFFSSGTHDATGNLSDYISFNKYDTSAMNEILYQEYSSNSLMGKMNQFAIEIDLDAQTANFYLNDMTVPAISATDIYNEVGGIQLIMKGSTSVAMDNVTVTAGGIADSPAIYGGVQESAPVDGKYNVRFLGAIGDRYALADYHNVGFHISASYGNGLVKTFDEPCKKVYSSITATMGISKTYTAQELGGTYIFAYTIKNIPTAAGKVTFSITPYFSTALGEAAGSTWEIVYQAGVYQGTTLIYPAASVPAYPASFQNVKVEGDANMMYVSSTTRATFLAYRDTLAAAGFEKYAEHFIGNSVFYTYASKNVTVTCNYDGNSGEARIVTDIGAARPDRAQDNVYQSKYDTLFTQVSLNNLKVNNGMSYVMRLADGRFIIFDGGSEDHDDDVKLYNLLLSQTAEGEKPVIAAWFLTHGHSDHYENFLAFAQKYATEVIFEKLVYNLPTEAISASQHSAFVDMKIEAIPGAEIVYARTGQQFHLADAVIDVLFTPDDFYPYKLTSAEYNDSSSIYRITCEGQSIMILGDSEDRGAAKLCARYGSLLKADIMQQAHHGYWAGSVELYQHIDPETVLWPSTSHWYYDLYDGAHGATSNATIHNSQNVKEIILAGNGTRILTLPYHPAKATRPETEVYTYAVGERIYSETFERMSYVYECGWFNVDTNNYHESSTLYRAYTALSLTEMDGQRGMLLTGKGSRAVLGLVRPEPLRHVETYTVDLELNVISLGSGFAIWYNDAAPEDSASRSLYSVWQTGKLRLALEIGRTETNVYVNGEYFETVANTCSDYGGLYFFLQGDVKVFVDAVTVTAGSYEDASLGVIYKPSGEGDYGYWA